MAAMLTNAVWKMQTFVHGGDSKALPSLLMLGAVSMLVYRHMVVSEEELAIIQEEGSDSLKKFLGMIILQMLPLIFMELRILACPDPVALLCRFGPKVTLMHLVFLLLRMAIQPEYTGWHFYNYVGVAAAVAVLYKGFNFRCTPSAVLEHVDVLFLIVLSFAGACLTTMLDVVFSGNPFAIEVAGQEFAEYIEILAFVPGVWVVHQASKFEVAKVCSVDPRQQALYFFGFMICFYITEDVINAFNIGMDLPMAAAAHMFHFLLLLDFAGFILAHLYNPENLKGALLRWLPDAVVPV